MGVENFIRYVKVFLERMYSKVVIPLRMRYICNPINPETITVKIIAKIPTTQIKTISPIYEPHVSSLQRRATAMMYSRR